MFQSSRGQIQADILNISVNTHIMCGREIRFLQVFVTSLVFKYKHLKIKIKLKLN